MEEIPYTLISKHLSGESTEADDAELWQWLGKSDEHQQIFEETLRMYAGPLVTVNNHETERRLGKILFIKQRQVRLWLPFAAALLLIGVLTTAVLFMMTDVSISTPLGERKNIFLPDGSEVWLNGGTTIRYNRQTFLSTRKVFLSGEAHFDVRTSDRPFSIKYDSISASLYVGKVNIQAYASDVEKVATVEDGIVVFTDVRKTLVKLEASTDHEVISHHTYGLLSMSVTQNLNFKSWLTEIYAFDNESVPSVCALLVKGNAINSCANEKTDNRRVTGYFNFARDQTDCPTKIKEVLAHAARPHPNF